MKAPFTPDVDVLIVGAGPVGLTVFLLLSRYGIPHVIVEQACGSTNHPQVSATL